MVPWLFQAASAQSPQLEILALASAGDATQSVPNLAGFAGGVGIRRAPVGAMLRLRGGLTTTGAPVLALEPTARLWLAPPDTGGLAVSLGGGIQLEDRLYAVLSPGLTLDLGASDRLRPRVDAGYHLRPADDQWRLSLALGLAWGPGEQPPEIVEAPPDPEPPLSTGADAMLWLPRPVCAWLEPDAVLQAAGAPIPETWMDAGGPQPFDPQAGADVPEPFDGELVIAAWPGDRILLGAEPIEANDEGLAIVARPRGEATIEIRGGGRVEQHEIAFGREHVLWLSADPPSPIHVQFDLASDRLTRAAQQQIAEAVGAAGDWRFEIRGGHSPEGDPQRNEALARARSAAVAEALIAEGMPPDTIQIAEELVILGPDTAPEALRAAIIYPMEPERP